MQYFQKRACSSIKNLSKSTFLALIDSYDYQSKAGTTDGQSNYTPSPTKQFFNNLDAKSVPWYISSFDPSTGTVCVTVENPKGTQIVSVAVQKPSNIL